MLVLQHSETYVLLILIPILHLRHHSVHFWCIFLDKVLLIPIYMLLSHSAVQRYASFYIQWFTSLFSWSYITTFHHCCSLAMDGGTKDCNLCCVPTSSYTYVRMYYLKWARSAVRDLRLKVWGVEFLIEHEAQS